MVKKHVCNPRNFFVINVCSRGKTLFSHCILVVLNFSVKLSEDEVIYVET